jgi:hypothetical protein
LNKWIFFFFPPLSFTNVPTPLLIYNFPIRFKSNQGKFFLDGEILYSRFLSDILCLYWTSPRTCSDLWFFLIMKLVGLSFSTCSVWVVIVLEVRQDWLWLYWHRALWIIYSVSWNLYSAPAQPKTTTKSVLLLYFL